VSTAGKSATLTVAGVVGDGANNTGDQLFIDTVQPAWPQSKPVLLADDGTSKLLVQEGFRVAGQSAAKGV
jgi:hypothetical protein